MKSSRVEGFQDLHHLGHPGSSVWHPCDTRPKPNSKRTYVLKSPSHKCGGRPGQSCQLVASNFNDFNVSTTNAAICGPGEAFYWQIRKLWTWWNDPFVWSSWKPTHPGCPNGNMLGISGLQKGTSSGTVKPMVCVFCLFHPWGIIPVYTRTNSSFGDIATCFPLSIGFNEANQMGQSHHAKPAYIVILSPTAICPWPSYAASITGDVKSKMTMKVLPNCVSMSIHRLIVFDSWGEYQDCFRKHITCISS